jgi:hypothetical protein
LLEKFDGTQSKFWGFVNQTWLIFRLQSWQYSTGASQVGFIRTLLSGVVLSWFVPLLEKNSTLFDDLNDFLTEVNDTFGETNRVWMATTKLLSLRQWSLLASIYAIDFHQLTCDVDWDDNTLTNTFYWGLWDDVKDLQVTSELAWSMDIDRSHYTSGTIW